MISAESGGGDPNGRGVFVRLDEVAESALSLVEVSRELFGVLDRIDFSQAIDIGRISVFRSFLARQIEALNAVSILVSSELGGATNVFVRPACEEFIWLKYLKSIPVESCAALLFLMLGEESVRSLDAQQKYSGKEGMKRLGFPAQFVNAAQRQRAEFREKIEALGSNLGWPREGNYPASVPSVAWIAGRVGEDKLYSLIYSSASRAVHFSPSEAGRRMWQAPDGAVDYANVGNSRYRAHFSLYWCSELLFRTLVLCMEVEKEFGDPLRTMELDGDYFERLEKAVQGYRKYGEVPIIRPEEYNLKRK